MLAKQPSAEQLAVLKAAAAISAQTMRQLEPNNPKSHFKATSALLYEAPVRDFKQAVQGFLRAFELSRQQRSDFWSVQSAVNALSFATTRPSEVGHSALAAAVAAFEQTAEAALRRCKRLLPEVDVERARPLLPGAHEQLQLWQQQASSRRCASSAASQASGSAQRAAARQQPDRTRRDLDARHITDCDSCGQPAVGLRRCGRCKKAQYCRCVVQLDGGPAAGRWWLVADVCLPACPPARRLAHSALAVQLPAVCPLRAVGRARKPIGGCTSSHASAAEESCALNSSEVQPASPLVSACSYFCTCKVSCNHPQCASAVKWGIILRAPLPPPPPPGGGTPRGRFPLQSPPAHGRSWPGEASALLVPS